MRRLAATDAALTAGSARQLAEKLQSLIGTEQSDKVVEEIEALTSLAQEIALHLPPNDADFQLGRALAREARQAPQPAEWEGE